MAKSVKKKLVQGIREKGFKETALMRKKKAQALDEAAKAGININRYSRWTTVSEILKDTVEKNKQKLEETQRRIAQEKAEKQRLEKEKLEKENAEKAAKEEAERLGERDKHLHQWMGMVHKFREIEEKMKKGEQVTPDELKFYKKSYSRVISPEEKTLTEGRRRAMFEALSPTTKKGMLEEIKDLRKEREDVEKQIKKLREASDKMVLPSQKEEIQGVIGKLTEKQNKLDSKITSLRKTKGKKYERKLTPSQAREIYGAESVQVKKANIKTNVNFQKDLFNNRQKKLDQLRRQVKREKDPFEKEKMRESIKLLERTQKESKREIEEAKKKLEKLKA